MFSWFSLEQWVRLNWAIIVCLDWPGLDHVFFRLGPVPPTPPSLPGLHARTCMGTLPQWEPTWQYLVKITNIQVDITFIIPKLIDEVPSHVKGAQWLKWPGIITLAPNEEEFPCRCEHEEWAMKEAWEGQGPVEWRCDLARDYFVLVQIYPFIGESGVCTPMLSALTRDAPQDL